MGETVGSRGHVPLKAMLLHRILSPQQGGLYVMIHWLYVNKTHSNQCKQKENLLKGQKGAPRQGRG